MNPLFDKLRNGEAARGVWSMLPSVESNRLLSQLLIDWILIDAEHAPMDDLTLARIVACVASGNGPVPIVRVADNSTPAIKRALDAGAYGIVVPMVDTPDEARAAVEAAKFPPLGKRSFGSPFAPLAFNTTNAVYLNQANQETLLIIQAESKTALRNINRVMRVPGVDAVLIGPADLSISMGIPLNMNEPSPKLEKAISKILKAAKKNGIPAGIYCPNGETAARRIEQGFQLVNIATDIFAMLGGVQTHLDTSYE
jgi:4-hydroxy-2-oxoheptanedioate aldolase